MKFSIPKKIKKAFKITFIIIGVLLLLMFSLPAMFPETVSQKIKQWTNKSINGELNFSKARLSFFNHFPSLTLTLYDFTLKGSKPFEKDTLIASKELALGINLKSVFSKSISISQIFVSNGNINIEVNKNGEANYNVYKNDTAHQTKNAADTGSASLNLEHIQIDKSNLVYDDRSIPILITAKGFNYSGKGDLSKAIFDLASSVKIDSFDLDYNQSHYIGSKKLKANLITKINTNSLAFIFEKNDLVLNRLPFNFNGKFEFLKNGYNMNFEINSDKADLYDVLSALPPEYAPWFSKIDAGGKTEITASLKGKYIASENEAPDLSFNMKVRDGYLDYDKAPATLKNLYVDFSTSLPKLNTDSLHVDLDSLYFNMDKSYLATQFHLTGLNTMLIKSKAKGELDLLKLSRGMGLQGMELAGTYRLQFDADGKYQTKIVQSGLRKKDTIVTSIPSFRFTSSLENGFIKYKSLPKAIEKISFVLNAACPDNNYKHSLLSIENINANVLTDYLKGFIKIKAGDVLQVDADIKSLFHLSDVQQFYPLDSMQLKGDLFVDVTAKGNFDQKKKIFPVTNAQINLKNGTVQTKYYPHPIEKINVSATVQSRNGSLKDLAINLLPAAFEFEGQPFQMQMNLKDFSNIKYNITSKGTIDIGKIYKVFAIKGYDAKGFIKTDLSLRGMQSDAASGHYERLFNSGTLQLNDLLLHSDLFPMPFLINKGVFHFDQDKMFFDQFKAKYGNSDFTLNGYLNNVVNYATKNNAPLKGNFDLKSNNLIVDELMAYADTSSKNKTTAATGVVIIPSNLSVTLNANANKVSYNGLNLTNVKGQLIIDSSKLVMKQSGFTIINAPVVMDATYKTVSPTKATFDYHINAKNFDIHKAYNEIKLFHDLATSAASVHGIVSLDYQLSGRLDSNMHPVYPSLKGAGVLSLGKVKVKGMKLMRAVSKATNRDSLNDPDLKDVNIKTKIENNIITIERTKLRIMGFRPRFEGQVSFDGKLNLTGRVGLPPFGIFGIPFTVTGTQSNPNVRLKRGKDSDKLEETEDKE